MTPEPCPECPHAADPHVMVVGPTVGIIVCPEPECECDMAVLGMKRPPPDFVAAVRKAIQYGKELL